jgi:hypothetical protein
MTRRMQVESAHSLVRYIDLKVTNEVSHWYRLVVLPLLVRFDVVDEDNEVVALALEVDLGLGNLAFGHGCCGGRGELELGFVEMEVRWVRRSEFVAQTVGVS